MFRRIAEKSEEQRGAQGGGENVVESNQVAPPRKRRQNNQLFSNGMYALVVPMSGKAAMSAMEQVPVVGNMSATQGGGDKKKVSGRIRVVICDLSQVCADAVGDFVREEGALDKPLGRLFEEDGQGGLNMRYYSTADGPTLPGRQNPSDVLHLMEDAPGGPAECNISVGFSNIISVFNTIPKVGEVIELGGAKAGTSSTKDTKDKPEFFSPEPTSKSHPKYNSWPIVSKLSLLYSYASLGNMPTSKKEMAESKLALVDNHASLSVVVPNEGKRFLHKTGQMGANYLVHVPCPLYGKVASKTEKGKVIHTNPIPTYEYVPQGEADLIEMGALDSSGLLGGKKSTEDDLDHFYSSYVIGKLLGTYPQTAADVQKTNKEGGSFWKAEINVGLTHWGSRKSFFDPESKNPLSFKPGAVTFDPDTDLNYTTDGASDRYGLQVQERGFANGVGSSALGRFGSRRIFRPSWSCWIIIP